MPCFEDCTRPAKRALVVVRENQRTAVINNPRKLLFQLTQFDNCVDCDGRRADFVISHPDRRKVIIELKGKDVEGAREQVINTLQFMKNAGLIAGNVAALIVCSRVPLGVSSVQRLTGALRQAGISRVKVKCREWAGEFEELFV